MKVLILAPHFFAPEYFDGINKITFNIVKENPDYQADFLYLYDELSGQAQSFQHANPQTQIHTLSQSLRDIRGLKKALRWILTPRIWQAVDQRFVSVLIEKLNEIASSYDVLIFESLLFAPVIAGLSENLQKKSVLSVIDSSHLFFSRRAATENSWIKKALWKLEVLKIHLFEMRTYRLPCFFHFVSDVDLAHTVGLYGHANKMSFIPNGVEIPESRPASHSEGCYFLGDFGYRPNLEAAFFLGQVFKSESLRADLTFIGKNAQRIESLAAMSSRIKIRGFVEDINAECSQFALFLAPLFNGAGIKNKVLEAMALGKVVLGTSLAFEGIQVQNDKDCVILDSRDPAEWAKHIDALLQEPEKLKSMGQSARQCIEGSYSWTKIRQRYFELFKKVQSQ